MNLGQTVRELYHLEPSQLRSIIFFRLGSRLDEFNCQGEVWVVGFPQLVFRLNEKGLKVDDYLKLQPRKLHHLARSRLICLPVGGEIKDATEFGFESGKVIVINQIPSYK